LLTAFYNDFNAWTALLTIFLTLVVYDQCAPPTRYPANCVSTLTEIAQSNTYG
jgi:hypothetical protein